MGKSTKEYKKKYYQKNREKILQYNKKYKAPKEYIKRYNNKIRFGGLRDFILERDNWQCVQCGMSQEQHLLLFNRSLTIDHIDRQGRNSKVPNNNPNNLQTLCLRCHQKKDGKKKNGRQSIPA